MSDRINNHLTNLVSSQLSSSSHLLLVTHVHQGKLSLLHPIYASSGSSAYVFAISGVMYEGGEKVVYRRQLNSGMYFSSESGSDSSGIDPVIKSSFWRKLCVSASSSGIFFAVPTRIWYPYSVMPLYYRCCIIGGGRGRGFL